MVLVVVLTLRDLKKTKRKKTRTKKHWGVDRKKISGLDGAKKLLINRLTKILLRGWDFWVFAHINFGENWGFFA